MNDMVSSPASAGWMQLRDIAPGAGLMFALYFDPHISKTINDLAEAMSRDQISCPEHLLGKPAACAVVIRRAFLWNLDPYFVAAATFMTPNKKIGYEGALVLAAIDRHLEGGVKFKHYGDWTRVQGKSAKKVGSSGKEFDVPTWTDKDAEGLGVTVSAKVRGDREVRTLNVDLNECKPRNSILWAISPRQQICYAASRRFAKLVVPAALMGLPPDFEDSTTAPEIHMGDAERVHDEEIIQPRPADTQNVEDFKYGEPAEQPADTQPPQPEPKPERQGGRITEQQKATLSKMLNDRNLTARFLEAFDLEEPGELSMTKMNEAMAWIREQSPA